MVDAGGALSHFPRVIANAAPACRGVQHQFGSLLSTAGTRRFPGVFAHVPLAYIPFARVACARVRAVLIAALLISTTLAAFPAARAEPPAAALAPFTAQLPPLPPLPELNGGPLDPATLKGRVVLVHFFATWCEPCREELPALSRLAADEADRLTVLAVNVAEVDVRVRRFFESLPVSFPIVMDRDRAFTRSWNISALPSTVVLDPQHRPRLRAVGEVGWDAPDVRSALAALQFDAFPWPPGVSPAVPPASGDTRP
ncbi:TlpA family protein disulfide reductase [Xanthobacteraceae bacterium A53D]